MVGSSVTIMSVLSGRRAFVDAFVRRPTVSRARRWSTSYYPVAAKRRPLAVPSEEYPDLLIPPPDGIPYPTSLSPSAVLEYLKCPQSYLFQYLLNIRQPTNEVLAKGTMCHTALERVFDLKCQDRTRKTLHNLLRSAWREAREKEPYDALFRKEKGGGENGEVVVERDTDAERTWGQEAMALLDNYVALEDPARVPPPNPIQREIWLNRDLSVDPNRGITGNDDDDDVPTDVFRVRGIVDRIDLLRVDNDNDDDDNEEETLALRIVDYKTGKAPDLKYDPRTNRRIADESFFQLKIYALLLREILSDDGDEGYGTKQMVTKFLPDDYRARNVDVRTLRLLYLTSSNEGEGRWMDMDLGATRQERDARLQEVHATLARVWREIHELVDAQDATLFKHCDRPFCSCHKTRPTFVKGTVWERTAPATTTIASSS